MKTTVILGGSHGALRVHRATGFIIERVEGCDCSDCGGVGYADILMFDPADIAREGDFDWLDIVWCGFWDDQGRYEPAITHRTVWTEKWGEDMDACVAMALLAAPVAMRTQ